MSQNEALMIGFVLGAVFVIYIWMTVEVMK